MDGYKQGTDIIGLYIWYIISAFVWKTDLKGEKNSVSETSGKPTVIAHTKIRWRNQLQADRRWRGEDINMGNSQGQRQQGIHLAQCGKTREEEGGVKGDDWPSPAMETGWAATNTERGQEKV